MISHSHISSFKTCWTAAHKQNIYFSLFFKDIHVLFQDICISLVRKLTCGVQLGNIYYTKLLFMHLFCLQFAAHLPSTLSTLLILLFNLSISSLHLSFYSLYVLYPIIYFEVKNPIDNVDWKPHKPYIFLHSEIFLYHHLYPWGSKRKQFLYLVR